MKNYKYSIQYRGATFNSNTMKSIYERIAELENITISEVKRRMH